MSVIASPFNKIRPSGVLLSFFSSTSSASSSTRFMYSSKPISLPSNLPLSNHRQPTMSGGKEVSKTYPIMVVLVVPLHKEGEDRFK